MSDDAPFGYRDTDPLVLMALHEAGHALRDRNADACWRMLASLSQERFERAALTISSVCVTMVRERLYERSLDAVNVLARVNPFIRMWRA